MRCLQRPVPVVPGPMGLPNINYILIKFNLFLMGLCQLSDRTRFKTMPQLTSSSREIHYSFRHLVCRSGKTSTYSRCLLLESIELLSIFKYKRKNRAYCCIVPVPVFVVIYSFFHFQHFIQHVESLMYRAAPGRHSRSSIIIHHPFSKFRSSRTSNNIKSTNSFNRNISNINLKII